MRNKIDKNRHLDNIKIKRCTYKPQNTRKYNKFMETYFVGAIGVVIGLTMFFLGFKVKKKFQGVAEYSGIGGFRITPKGIIWFGGCLLEIFGIGAILVSFMLLCL